MRSSYQNGECIREQIRDTYEPISFYTSSESSSEIRCCNHEGKYFHQKFGFVSSPSDDQCNQERIMLLVSVMMTRIIDITENKIQFREVDQKTAASQTNIISRVYQYFTLKSTPSCHKYSYFGPPDMTGQDSSVQTSATVPYNNCTRLKKSTT